MSGNTQTANLAKKEYLPAPRGLTTFQRETWESVVFGMPKGHFLGHHQPLLHRYVVVAQQLKHLNNNETAILDRGISGLFYETDSGQRKPIPQLAQAAVLSAELQSLSTKLKILPAPDRAEQTRKKKAALDAALENDSTDLLYNQPDETKH